MKCKHVIRIDVQRKRKVEPRHRQLTSRHAGPTESRSSGMPVIRLSKSICVRHGCLDPASTASVPKPRCGRGGRASMSPGACGRAMTRHRSVFHPISDARLAVADESPILKIAFAKLRQPCGIELGFTRLCIHWCRSSSFRKNNQADGPHDSLVKARQTKAQGPHSGDPQDENVCLSISL